VLDARYIVIVAAVGQRRAGGDRQYSDASGAEWP